MTTSQTQGELPIVVAALYKFVTLDDFTELKQPLLDCCNANGIKGTLLLAAEGINGTVAGSREGIDALLAWLRSDQRLVDLEHKESYTDQPPFIRMKVKLKKEIVTIGIPDVSPTKTVGTYVQGKEWDALLDDPDVIVIDTRNEYEYAVGTFENAVNPHTETFREFPDYVRNNLDPKKHKKVAMFCTGGIRCEKASSFMLEEGFEEVFHLEGGILKYIEQTKPEEQKWQGECFVFDERVTVDAELNKGSYEMCHACRMPITAEDMQRPEFEHGVSCHHCIDQRSDEQKAAAREREKQIQLAAKRGEQHLGSAQGAGSEGGSGPRPDVLQKGALQK